MTLETKGVGTLLTVLCERLHFFVLYDLSNRPGQFVKMMVALNIEFLSSSYYFSIIHPIQGINIS